MTLVYFWSNLGDTHQLQDSPPPIRLISTPTCTRVEQIRQLGPTSSQLQYTPSLLYELSQGSGLDRPWCPD
jgi:hypothetical protein